MTFIASYHSRTKPPYGRTIYADSEPEAAKIAKLYTKKGWLCTGVKQQQLKE